MPDMHSTRDPRGREISLDNERWSHIVDGHPELSDIRDDVLRAVQAPTEILARTRA
jgi:hypothetical protein